VLANVADANKQLFPITNRHIFYNKKHATSLLVNIDIECVSSIAPTRFMQNAKHQNPQDLQPIFVCVCVRVCVCSKSRKHKHKNTSGRRPNDPSCREREHGRRNGKKKKNHFFTKQRTQTATGLPTFVIKYAHKQQPFR